MTEPERDSLSVESIFDDLNDTETVEVGIARPDVEELVETLTLGRSLRIRHVDGVYEVMLWGEGRMLVTAGLTLHHALEQMTAKAQK